VQYGLAPGDMVITEGIGNLKDGMQIQLSPVSTK